MSKFFLQLVLSLMIGVSAALSFSPSIKSELHATLQKANAALHEMANTVVENMSNVAANVNAELSIPANSQDSTESSEEANVSVNGNADTTIGILLHNFSVNSSSTSGTQTTTEEDSSSLNVNLQNEIQSTLNVGHDTEE